MKPVMKFRATLSAMAVALSHSGAAHAQAVQWLDGRWEGPIELPNGAKLTAVFRVETKDGKTTTLFDSPAQGSHDLPASVKRDGNNVTFELPAAGLSYTGALAADGKTISGSVSQGGGTLPLTVTRQ